MYDSRFPNWSAPLIGALAGGVLGFKAGLKGQFPIWVCILTGSMIGGFAGAIVFVLEPRPRRDASEELLDELPIGHVIENPSHVVGRFLAVIGLLLCWIPGLGCLLNAIGLAVNRKFTDWARIASILGLLIGTFVLILFLGLGLVFGF